MRIVFVVALLLGVLAHLAHAERKRVAVLSFDGPSAEKIRGEVVKLLQKSHAVVSLDTWNDTAKAHSATKLTASNIKKVARKLDIDAVLEGALVESRNGFRIRLRLREGATGQTLEDLTFKLSEAHLDKATRRDIKDEVIDVISSLDGGEQTPPAARKARR